MTVILGFPAYKSILLITNLAIFIFLVTIIVKHYQSNNNLYSWSFLFHILCLAWLSIRGLFWYFTVISVDVWGESYFEVLYWMPNPLQFGSFLIFPLFFAQILYRGKWEIYWTYLRPIYIIVLVCLVLFQLFWALLALQVNTDVACDDASPDTGKVSNNCSTEHSSGAYRIITASCFLVLSVCQATFSFQVMYLDSKDYQRYFSIDPQRLLLVNVVLILSFLSKGIYQLGAYFLTNWFVLPDIPLQGREDVSALTLLTFELWDYVPTLLLMTAVVSKPIGRGSVTAASDSASMKRGGDRAGATNPMYGIFSGESDADEDDDVSVIDNEGWDHGAAGSYQKQSPSVQMRFEAPVITRSHKSWLTGTASFSNNGGPHSGIGQSRGASEHMQVCVSLDGIASQQPSRRGNYGQYQRPPSASIDYPTIPPAPQSDHISSATTTASQIISSSVSNTHQDSVARNREAYLAGLHARLASIRPPTTTTSPTIGPGISFSPMMTHSSVMGPKRISSRDKLLGSYSAGVEQ